MFTLIIGAIVQLLIFFFERWWTAHHPADPATAKTAFITHVAKPRFFLLGHKRTLYADMLFDKFRANYMATDAARTYGNTPLTEEAAKALVQRCIKGVTLSETEAEQSN